MKFHVRKRAGACRASETPADAVELLRATLDEESRADERLNSISLDEILDEAPSNLEDDEEGDEETKESEEIPAAAVATTRNRK